MESRALLVVKFGLHMSLSNDPCHSAFEGKVTLVAHNTTQGFISSSAMLRENTSDRLDSRKVNQREKSNENVDHSDQ
jgi:hypothetical protein